jgi:hypothetical protein
MEHDLFDFSCFLVADATAAYPQCPIENTALPDRHLPIGICLPGPLQPSREGGRQAGGKRQRKLQKRQ